MPSVARQHRQLLLDTALIIALTAISLWRLYPAIADNPFHRDEARWIGNSSLLREWRHPLGNRWQDEGYTNRYGTIDEANRRRSQPPLAMYALGLGLLIQGEDLPTTGYWIMDHDTEWNTDHGNMPTTAQLRADRWTNVAITIFTVIVIFLIGRTLTNRVGGVAGALIYAFHPLVLITGVRAWSDPLLVLLLALATWIAMKFATRPSLRNAILLGVLLGLGGATKLSPLVVATGLGLLALAAIALTLIRPQLKQSALPRLAIRLLIVPFVAWATFLAAYPYLWTAPISHTRRMFAFRAESFDLQASVSAAAVVPTRADAFRRVGAHLGNQFSTSGALAQWIEGHINRTIWTSLDHIDLILAVAGLLILVKMLLNAESAPNAAAVLLVLGGQSLLIILTLKIDYARYFLPIVLTVAVFAGVSIGWVLNGIAKFIRARLTA